jgi:uncharacterized sporulation protein YeaH/YhbH (DUF444 family)
MKITKDHQRFRQIIKGKIREDLRKFLSRGELIGREGKRAISIPVHGIDTPHFRYGDNNDSGVGSGEGKPGDQVGDGDGMGPGGTQEGRHIRFARPVRNRCAISSAPSARPCAARS